MNQETDKAQYVKEKHWIFRLMRDLFFVGLGIMAGRAYQADQLRQEAKIERKEGIAAIRGEVKKALRIDLDKAMKICSEASLRSLETVQKSNEALDSTKDSIEKEISK